MLTNVGVMAIAIITAIPLAVIAGRNLLLFPAIYFTIEMIFTKADLNLVLLGRAITTSRIFLLVFLFTFFIQCFLKRKNIIKDILALLKSNKVLTTFVVIYFLSPVVLALHSYFIFGIFPKYVFRIVIMSSWGFILGFLLPVDNENFSRMIKYWGISAIVIVIFFFPQSIYYYLSTNFNSISRTYYIDATKDAFLQFFYFLPQNPNACSARPCNWLFVDTFNKNGLSVGLFTSFFFLVNYYFTKRNLKRLLILSFTTLFIHYFLFINKGFATIMTFIITIGLYCATDLLYTFILQKKPFTKTSLIVPAILLIMIGHTGWQDFNRLAVPMIKKKIETVFQVNFEDKSHNKEIKYRDIVFHSQFASRFTIHGADNGGGDIIQGRLSYTFYRGGKMLREYPLKGYGPYANDPDPKVQKDFYAATTGHANIVDSIIVFGVLSGLFAHPEFFFPLLLLLFVNFRKVEFKFASFWITYFIGSFLLAFFDKYGGITPHVAFQIMMVSIFIRYLKKENAFRFMS
tara:strand:+ start:139344 stop:140891 length:1548 start_codon:yes stop_codon:yes gene_type:complete